jgi:hypothetical protein
VRLGWRQQQLGQKKLNWAARSEERRWAAAELGWKGERREEGKRKRFSNFKIHSSK